MSTVAARARAKRCRMPWPQVIFHLLNTGAEDFPLGIPKAHSYNFELAAMYVLVLGYFTVAGAGKYSVDEQVLGGELNFYGRLLGGEEEE